MRVLLAAVMLGACAAPAPAPLPPAPAPAAPPPSATPVAATVAPSAVPPPAPPPAPTRAAGGPSGRIVFDGIIGGKLGLFVATLGDGSAPRLLVEDGGGNPAFSADGRLVAYEAFTHEGNAQIAVVPAIGGKPQIVARCRKHCFTPAFAADGDLYFVDEPPRGDAVVRHVRPTGGAPATWSGQADLPLNMNADRRSFMAPLRDCDDAHCIDVVTLDGRTTTTPFRIERSLGDVSHVRITAAGDRLVFVATAAVVGGGGGPSLYIEAAGARAVRLARAHRIDSFALTDDGQWAIVPKRSQIVAYDLSAPDAPPVVLVDHLEDSGTDPPLAWAP